MIKTVELESYEEFFLSKEKSFIIRKGKVITKSITINGKVINNNMFLKEEEIIFDCFNFFEENKNLDIKIKVVALEKSVLEEIIFKKNTDKKIYQRMLLQLMEKNVLELEYQMYNSKGYILAMLKRYAEKDDSIDKKNIRPEFFYIGKTQFYKLYKEIKEEEFYKEENEKIYLDIPKIDNYLFKLKNPTSERLKVN